MRVCIGQGCQAIEPAGGMAQARTRGWHGSFAPVADFGIPQWLAATYLGAFGSALTFYLWAFALARTTPTRVAISVTINPVAASLVGAILLHEPIGWNLVGGIVTVFAGIWIATTAGR